MEETAQVVHLSVKSDKEVNGESVVVLSWKGHVGGTQTHTLSISLSPFLLLLYRTRESNVYGIGRDCSNSRSISPYNSNENENSEEGAGENFVSLLPLFYYATML